MNTSDITHSLSELRLHGMHQSWQSLLETRSYQELSLIDGLKLLLDAETLDRDQRRVQRLRHAARFRYQANLEELHYKASRGLDRNTIAVLADGQYITKGESVLISGPTGSGKSFLVSALGHQACRLSYKVAYFNMQKLSHQLLLARTDGTILKMLEKIARTQLLIIDDFGLQTLETQQRLDLLEIIEDRHRSMSTIIASQLPVASWYDVIGDNTIADYPHFLIMRSNQTTSVVIQQLSSNNFPNYFA